MGKPEMQNDYVVDELVKCIHHKYILDSREPGWREEEGNLDKLMQHLVGGINKFEEAIKKENYNDAELEIADIALIGFSMVNKLKQLKRG